MADEVGGSREPGEDVPRVDCAVGKRPARQCKISEIWMGCSGSKRGVDVPEDDACASKT